MDALRNKSGDKLKINTTSGKEVSLTPEGTSQPVKGKNIRPVLPEKIIKKKKE